MGGVTQIYAFANSIHYLAFDLLKSSKDVFPEAYPQKLGIFFHGIGVMDPEHPDFENDIAALAACSTIELQTGKEHSVALFKIQKTDLLKNSPDTLMRFNQKAKEYTLGFSIDDFFEVDNTDFNSPPMIVYGGQLKKKTNEE